MTQLEITDEEGALLMELLENGVINMHTEIMHTSSFDYKEGLKVKRDSLNRILSSLKKAELSERAAH